MQVELVRLFSKLHLIKIGYNEKAREEMTDAYWTSFRVEGLCQGTDDTLKKEIAQIGFKKKHIFLLTKKKTS